MTSQRGIPLDWMSYFVCGNVKCALVGYTSAIRKVLSSTEASQIRSHIDFKC